MEGCEDARETAKAQLGIEPLMQMLREGKGFSECLPVACSYLYAQAYIPNDSRAFLTGRVADLMLRLPVYRLLRMTPIETAEMVDEALAHCLPRRGEISRPAKGWQKMLLRAASLLTESLLGFSGTCMPDQAQINALGSTVADRHTGIFNDWDYSDLPF